MSDYNKNKQYTTKQNLWSFWIGVPILILLASSRLILKNLPLNRDEGTYAYLGKQAISGFKPYVDFYEMKTPMLFYWHGLMGKIFGFNEAGIRITALIFVLLTGISLFLIARKYVGNGLAMVAPVMYSLLSLNLFSLGFSMETEHIMNALVVCSLYLIIQSVSQPNPHKHLLGAGLIFTLAILTKQTSVIFFPVLALLYYGNYADRNYKWTHLWFFVIGGIIPLFLFAIIFTIHKSWDQVFFWLISYPSKYIASSDASNAMKNFLYFIKRITLFQITSFIFCFTALSIFLVKAWNKKHLWLIIYMLISCLSILPGFRFYGQYWQLIWPPLALITALAPATLSQKPKWLITVPLLVMVGVVADIIIKKDYYFNGKYTINYQKLYYQNPFDAIKKLSLYAKRQMNSEDKFMVFGSEPQAYLYAEKASPTPHIFMSMLSKHGKTFEDFTEDVQKTLNLEKPNYVLFNIFPFSWSITKDENDAIFSESYQNVVANYDAIASFSLADNTYSYIFEGGKVDPYKNNQIVLFKLK